MGRLCCVLGSFPINPTIPLAGSGEPLRRIRIPETRQRARERGSVWLAGRFSATVGLTLAIRNHRRFELQAYRLEQYRKPIHQKQQRSTSPTSGSPSPASTLMRENRCPKEAPWTDAFPQNYDTVVKEAL
jgi:hypothetical protein